MAGRNIRDQCGPGERPGPRRPPWLAGVLESGELLEPRPCRVVAAKTPAGRSNAPSAAPLADREHGGGRSSHVYRDVLPPWADEGGGDLRQSERGEPRVTRRAEGPHPDLAQGVRQGRAQVRGSSPGPAAGRPVARRRAG